MDKKLFDARILIFDTRGGVILLKGHVLFRFCSVRALDPPKFLPAVSERGCLMKCQVMPAGDQYGFGDGDPNCGRRPDASEPNTSEPSNSSNNSNRRDVRSHSVFTAPGSHTVHAVEKPYPVRTEPQPSRK